MRAHQLAGRPGRDGMGGWDGVAGDAVAPPRALGNRTRALHPAHTACLWEHGRHGAAAAAAAAAALPSQHRVHRWLRSALPACVCSYGAEQGTPALREAICKRLYEKVRACVPLCVASGRWGDGLLGWRLGRSPARRRAEVQGGAQARHAALAGSR